MFCVPELFQLATSCMTSGSKFSDVIRTSIRGQWKGVLFAGFCIIGTTVTTLAAPWPLKMMFDHVILGKPLTGIVSQFGAWLQAGSMQSLIVLAGIAIGLALLSAAFAYSQLLVTSRIGFEVVYKLRSELFNHLQRLSLAYHRKFSTGELLSKVVSDTNTLKDVYSEYLLALVTHVLSVAGMCAIMLMIDWQLGTLVILTFPLLFAVLYAILQSVRKSARRQRRQEGELVARLTEVLQALPLVQSFGRERYESERFESRSTETKEESIRTARMEAAASRLVEIVRALGTGIVILFGGMQVLKGRMTPGDLLVFSTYIVALFKPVRIMARLSARITKASASAERIREILDTEPDIIDAPEAIKPDRIQGAIAFKNVVFSYAADSGHVISGVDFQVKPGTKVALVGASGAGKSTLVNLLLRLYDPAAGRILIDGVDLKKYNREHLRQHIGYVQQNTLLFGASFRENISYGKLDASQQEIEDAAKAVGLHDFICSLPKGYDEELGERGAILSGGQRQRLSLARAIIKNPAIMIMDEPTSALDGASEAEVRLALANVTRGRTVVLIAHHLKSVSEADLILVLKGGRIIERGSHETLLKQGAHYCSLFNLPVPIQAAIAARRH